MNKQKKTFYILATIALFMLLTYGYFVKQTIFNVVSRQNTVEKIQSISSELAVLESSYMSLSSSLTIEEAYAMGFDEFKSADTIFVERLVPSVAMR